MFGASVLSMSKRIMNEIVCMAEDLGNNVYYQDTDSMHIEHDKIQQFSEAFQKKYNQEIIGEDFIGCFYNDFDELKDCLLRNMYHDSTISEEVED